MGNVKKQEPTEETLMYAMFAIPLSTEKLLDYDETFTTTISTIVSILTLIIFIVMCIPYAITHVIPMVIVYGWVSLFLLLGIVLMTYVVVTLPTLQKRVEVPDMEEVVENGKKIKRQKMVDAPAGDDGKPPQEEKIVMEKDADGKEVEKKIMVNKQVGKMKFENRDRAFKYLWPSCKAKRKDPDDEKQEENKDENAKPDEKDEKDMTEDEKKEKEKTRIDALMDKKKAETGAGGCKNFLKGLVPSTDRDYKWEWKKVSMKWIDFRKIIVYFVFIYLYNFLFNWAILLYMGHGYIDAIKIDFFSPSRKLTMYLKHVLNSIHTLVEFVNMLF